MTPLGSGCHLSRESYAFLRPSLETARNIPNSTYRNDTHICTGLHKQAPRGGHLSSLVLGSSSHIGAPEDRDSCASARCTWAPTGRSQSGCRAGQVVLMVYAHGKMLVVKSTGPPSTRSHQSREGCHLLIPPLHPSAHGGSSTSLLNLTNPLLFLLQDTFWPTKT